MTEAGSSATVRIGEVVEASTIGFTAQCYRLYEAPPLGSLVRSGNADPVYGVVGEVTTQSIDPGRHPIAMGEREESEEDVYSGNPQLSRLLSTDVRVIAIGHRDDGRLRRYLAPLPPRIHSFVYRCAEEEVRELCESLEFLPLVLSARVGSPDDVVAAFLRQASTSRPDPDEFLVDAGKELAPLLAGQLPRLNSLLRRLAP